MERSYKSLYLLIPLCSYGIELVVFSTQHGFLVRSLVLLYMYIYIYIKKNHFKLGHGTLQYHFRGVEWSFVEFMSVIIVGPVSKYLFIYRSREINISLVTTTKGSRSGY